MRHAKKQSGKYNPESKEKNNRKDCNSLPDRIKVFKDAPGAVGYHNSSRTS